MARMIITAVVGVVAGALLGIGLTLATVGLLPVVAGGTLTCSLNGDGTVTACANDSGKQVKVPHHIQIRR